MSTHTILNSTDLQVLKVLMDAWPHGINRASLAELCEIPRTTVYDSLVRLELRNLVYFDKVSIRKRGHPPVYAWAKPPMITEEMWERVDRYRACVEELNNG